MRTTKVAAVLTLAVVVLTGCGNTGNADRVGGDDSYPAAGVVTIEYDGRDLDCVTWHGSHNEVGLTCDFVKYHFGEAGLPVPSGTE